MIKYYPHLQFTLAEIPDKSVLLIHALTGCMFHCYKCINYDEIVLNSKKDYYTMNQVSEIICKHENIIDIIVLSGGEFLSASMEDLIKDLSIIKNVCSVPIIVYTTGVYFEKMRALYDLYFVDGYHVDLKLPYHLLGKDDDELIRFTLGKSLNKDELNQMKQAIEWTVEVDTGMNQIRSVKYPFLDESAFNECRNWIEELNKKYHKQTPYEVHKFFDPSCTT